MFGSSIGHLSLVAAIDWQNAFQTLVGIPLKILIIVASCIISWLTLVALNRLMLSEYAVSPLRRNG